MIACARHVASLYSPSWLQTLTALLVGMNCLLPTSARAANANVLWEIVHTQCVPGKQQAGDPSPCAIVDIGKGVTKGYALLKDLRGVSQYLLIPTSQVAGIESSAILAKHAPNYFSEAWRWRSLFESLLHRRMPRDAISLAINSASGRSQNQLHVHIDCLRSDVSKILQLHQAEVGARWSPFPEPLMGHRYSAMRVLGDNLNVNPFKLLASRIPGADHEMGAYSLVVVGATFADHRGGFIILAGHTDAATEDRGSGEELQDHSCEIVKELPSTE